MEEIKIKVTCKELNGGTSTSDVTFSSSNTVTEQSAGTGPTVEVENIDSTGATAGQVPTADGNGNTTWKNVVIDLSDYETKADARTYAKKLIASVNAYNHLIITLYDADDHVLGTAQDIDLAAASVIVSGHYDSVNHALVLELASGSEISIPVGDLVAGLVSTDELYTCFTEVDLPN